MKKPKRPLGRWEDPIIKRDPVECENCGKTIPRGDTVILAGSGERTGKYPRQRLCLDCYD